MRFDIAMDHLQLVGRLQSLGCLSDVIARVGDHKPTPLADHFSQIRPVDVFHHQEVHVACLFGVIGRDDIRMSEPRGRLNFASKSLGGLRVFEYLVPDQLQRDQTVH